MSFTRYKKYYISNNGVLTPMVYESPTGEIKYYTSNEEIHGYIPNEEIIQAVRSPMGRRYTKFFLLHDDETIKEEITQNVLTSGSIEKKNSSGQSRSCNLSLVNEKTKVLVGFKGKDTPIYEYRYMWLPVPRKDNLWYYHKLKVVNGIQLYDRQYEVDEGVFVMYDPSFSVNQTGNTVSLQLYDKFALLDGTVDGIGDVDYEIPVGASLSGALTSLVRLEKTPGVPYDLKDVQFPSKYINEKIPYTLKKTKDNSIGDIIKDLSLMISCDYKYNDFGNLTISNTLSEIDYHNRSIAWTFDEYSGEYRDPSMSVARSKIKNRITVIGANTNGRLAKGTAENTNPYSSYNINSEFGIRAKTITEDLLYTDMLCRDRARYELKKLMRDYVSLSFQSAYIPHLEPDDIIRFSNDDLGIHNELFVVNSVSIPHDPSAWMSITCSNVEEISEVNSK
jgi:hypothetical protein